MCGVCVVCGQTDYTAKLKVFRVKVLSVAIAISFETSCNFEHTLHHRGSKIIQTAPEILSGNFLIYKIKSYQSCGSLSC